MIIIRRVYLVMSTKKKSRNNIMIEKGDWIKYREVELQQLMQIKGDWIGKGK